MAEALTPSEWSQLGKLAQKAAYYEKEQHKNQNNFDYLVGVARYAGRMAGG